ncbi:lysophospholipid acyltransferase family protein [Pseudofulvibacter geojedonensis]|uniref:Lysophospholipid acyltransferase family protein n=1 Tax=Pseudofulvibacter geojedonensis TaxID=1123758 RepID=A0ABW3HZS1_9FLAO
MKKTLHFLAYIIGFPILWTISVLPFPIFYLFSDLIFVLVFHIIGYRKKVVYNNIKLVFPDKSDKEILLIRKKFYKHMCDMFLEMIKTMSMSEAEMRKRFQITNIPYIQDLEKRKNIMLMASHYASWEWGIILQRDIEAKAFGVYKRIRNPHFDKLVKNIRAKYNSVLINTKETIPTVLSNHRKGIKAIYGFVSDQSPKLNKALHWVDFMNINVPAFTGAEMLAKKCDLAVCYFKVEKIKRGYYKATYIPLAENPKELDNYEITDLFIKELEKQLIEAPEYYLWTHKRWKHRGKNPNQKATS